MGSATSEQLRGERHRMQMHLGAVLILAPMTKERGTSDRM
jgi:hypothetical protein